MVILCKVRILDMFGCITLHDSRTNMTKKRGISNRKEKKLRRGQQEFEDEK